jgi:biotin synthase
MVAVSRLVMGDIPKAHCTHEPNTTSLLAEANLLFSEVGSSPRDERADSSHGIGRGVLECSKMLREVGWKPEAPSNCFKSESGGASEGSSESSETPMRDPYR